MKSEWATKELSWNVKWSNSVCYVFFLKFFEQNRKLIDTIILALLSTLKNL
jgi:hypothetical protein